MAKYKYGSPFLLNPCVSCLAEGGAHLKLRERKLERYTLEVFVPRQL